MRKLLLLLGAAKYPRRSDLALPAFSVSYKAFKAAMTAGTSPIIFPDDCLDLFDDDRAWVDQQSTIDEWLSKKRSETRRPEALLLYYVGHGGIEKGEQVYLTINSTNKLDPYFSSVPRDSLARLLRSSANDLRKFLIIDCCFAASITKTMMSPIQDKMTLELREVGKAVSKPNSGGFAALCASSSLSTANANGREGLTQFTDGLLSALLIGDPSSQNDLSFETVLPLIAQQLRERYGDEAVPPSSYFADDFYEAVHRLPIFPNRAERLPDNLQLIERRISTVFRKHHNSAIKPSVLQSLARPIEREAIRLTHLGIISEMLTRDGDRVERDAAIFTAAVIIYKRQELQFLSSLLAIASKGRPVRAAVMWRILRAIRRLIPQALMNDDLRRELRNALIKCARNYDSPAGTRFQTRDIVLMVAQIAEFRIVRLDLVRDGIFSSEQISEWIKYKETLKKS